MPMTDALVLCYHAVSDGWPWRYAVRPAALEAQVESLLARGYRPVTFGGAVGGRGRRFAVTFDDAHASVLERGRPVLERLGVPATVFACTAFVEERAPLTFGRLGRFAGSEHAGELASMGWDELRELAGAGWEIGSHGHTHTHLASLDDADLRHELERSRRLLEDRLGRPCLTIAYPFGSEDARVATAAHAAGYVAGAALERPWPRRTDPLRFPRVTVRLGDTDATFARRTGPVRRRLHAPPALTRLRRGSRSADRLPATGDRG